MRQYVSSGLDTILKVSENALFESIRMFLSVLSDEEIGYTQC